MLLYSSLAVGVAAVLAAPGVGFHYLRSKAGSPPVMLVGACCFSFVAVQAMVLAPGSEDGSTSLRASLWLLYVVYGAGRSVWESTVKVGKTYRRGKQPASQPAIQQLVFMEV